MTNINDLQSGTLYKVTCHSQPLEIYIGIFDTKIFDDNMIFLTFKDVQINDEHNPNIISSIDLAIDIDDLDSYTFENLETGSPILKGRRKSKKSRCYKQQCRKKTKRHRKYKK